MENEMMNKEITSDITQERLKKALNKIGQRWYHPETLEERWYVNKAWKYGGLESTYDRSSRCRINCYKGEDINDVRADKLISSVDKFWLTLDETGEVRFHVRGESKIDDCFMQDICTEIMAEIKRIIAEEEAQMADKFEVIEWMYEIQRYSFVYEEKEDAYAKIKELLKDLYSLDKIELRIYNSNSELINESIIWQNPSRFLKR